MWKHLRLTQLQQQLVGMVVLVALLAISLLTFKLPERSADVSVGSYQLGAFPSGLAFYAGQGASYYYSISPLNDYFITSDGIRTTLLSGESFNSKVFKNSTQQSKAQKIVDTLTTYFGVSNPEYKIYRQDNLEYSSQRIDQDTVEITREFILPTNKEISAVATTLTYDDLSYVFAPNTGVVFSNQTAEEIKWLENQSGLDLTPGIVPDGYKDMRLFLWELSSNQIVLFNPGRAGYFIIETGVNQTILVNPKDKLIEIVESVPFDATSVESTVRISVASELPK